MSDSTHDARMLKSTYLHKSFEQENVIPDCAFSLERRGEIPLITIGDSVGHSVFLRLLGLVKSNNDDSNDPKKGTLTKNYAV